MAELHPVAAPTIDGLRFRSYGEDGDPAALAAVANAANRADGASETWTPASLRNEIEGSTHGDPREDVLIATVDGRPVAFAQLDWSDTTDGDRHYWSLGHVHPDWRRRGIGGALLTLSEARRRVVAASHEHEGGRFLVSVLEDGDGGGRALLAARGYEQVRLYRHMVRPDLEDIVVPSLPPDLEVRPITAELLRPVFDGMLEAFRDHFGSHDPSPEAFHRWHRDPDFSIDLLVIAFDGSEVAGGVQGYIVPAENRANGYLRGWADPVFTRRPWRRRGVASALLGRALIRLREHGMTSAQLDVDTRNPSDALTLYERHGFRADRTSSEWHKPLGD
jgi:GNAT superfamily N-acetyltransferase